MYARTLKAQNETVLDRTRGFHTNSHRGATRLHCAVYGNVSCMIASGVG